MENQNYLMEVAYAALNDAILDCHFFSQGNLMAIILKFNAQKLQQKL